jgi:hypothetical protein
MQLMQWNFFLENGLLTFENGRMRIHYDKYHDVVGKLLKKVLEVQYDGDKAASDRFIDQYAVWKEDAAWCGCEKYSRPAAIAFPAVQIFGARRMKKNLSADYTDCRSVPSA